MGEPHALRNNPEDRIKASVPPAKAPVPRAQRPRRKPVIRWLLAGTVLFVGAGVGVILYEESQSSRLQARELSAYAQRLTYQVEAGPTDAVHYPVTGPFDERLGYARLPRLLERLASRGFQIDAQARFSPALLDYTAQDLFPPYREKARAGLSVADCRGEAMYDFRYPIRHYADFESIPPVMVSALLFIEDRELLQTDYPYMNPAVNWPRFIKAGVLHIGKKLGIEADTMGGSTLATQIEKYRHSPDGLTGTAKDKLLQMASASVRAYQEGPDTWEARKRLVLDYMNSVPLSAAPGYGEVNGVGDGLHVWFAADFDQTNRLLQLQDAQGEALQEQALALRQSIYLMIAHRRPSWYLTQGRTELAELTDAYLRLMARAGDISPALRDAALAREVVFRDFLRNPAVAPMETNKGNNMARTRLGAMLGQPLYDLDRLDLSARTTLNRDLQNQVSDYLASLSDPNVAASVGLIGERLLNVNNTGAVNYSFTLFERTADGYRVRVQTDNTDQPFDINEGSKLELGSTAKLRVLANYLEIIQELHQRFAGQSAQALRNTPVDPQDALTRWAIDYLASNTDHNLPAMLDAALERSYSANPQESFFTGGGVHTFGNFRREDNNRIATVKESLRESLNLPFVRIMRDIVRYTIHHEPGSSAKLLGDDSDPRRQAYLQRFADREGQVFLQRFWRKYQGKNTQERLEAFLDGLRQNPVRLSAVHRYLYPDADEASFGQFLRARLPNEQLTERRIRELYKRYGPGAFNLPDQAYVARVHPLELWLLSYLHRHPEARLRDAVEASAQQRQEVYGWLFRTRAKNARDSRIRTMLEVEAFLDIHRRWQRLGYPFGHLVPSLATALGSSGDRPAALAELMGIILNDGVRLPAVRIDHLHFAKDTPYEVELGRTPVQGEQVMHPDVAAALKGALADVVEGGTARRLQGTFKTDDGTVLTLGGKTGTGDNRIESVGAGGQRIRSRALNRTATFVFYLGDDHFGTLTAFVPGREAANFRFTSALPVQVLKGMAPLLQPYLTAGGETGCRRRSEADTRRD